MGVRARIAVDPAHVFSHNYIGYPWLLPRAFLSEERLLWDLNIILHARIGQVERES